MLLPSENKKGSDHNSLHHQHSQTSNLIMKPPVYQDIRKNYQQLKNWTVSQLKNISKRANTLKDEQNSSIKFQRERKVIISMTLELTELMKRQCKEKGDVMEILLQYLIGFVNTIKREYDMLSYGQIKIFRENMQEMEKQNSDRCTELKEKIDVLQKQKDHKWRNLYLVVKDNRVLRRQNAKLKHRFREQSWNVQKLQSQLVQYKRQSLKLRFLIQSFCDPKETHTSHLYGRDSGVDGQYGLKHFVSNNILLSQLEKRIQKYPDQARKILKSELIDLQIEEMNDLDKKIKYILDSLEENNEICEDFHDYDFGVKTVKMYYNAFVQTEIQTSSIGVNTKRTAAQEKRYQIAKIQTKASDLANLKMDTQVVKEFYVPKKIYQNTKKQDKPGANSLLRKKYSQLAAADREPEPQKQKGVFFILKNYSIKIPPTNLTNQFRRKSTIMAASFLKNSLLTENKQKQQDQIEEKQEEQEPNSPKTLQNRVKTIPKKTQKSMKHFQVIDGIEEQEETRQQKKQTHVQIGGEEGKQKQNEDRQVLKKENKKQKKVTINTNISKQNPSMKQISVKNMKSIKSIKVLKTQRNLEKSSKKLLGQDNEQQQQRALQAKYIFDEVQSKNKKIHFAVDLMDKSQSNINISRKKSMSKNSNQSLQKINSSIKKQKNHRRQATQMIEPVNKKYLPQLNSNQNYSSLSSKLLAEKYTNSAIKYSNKNIKLYDNTNVNTPNSNHLETSQSNRTDRIGQQEQNKGHKFWQRIWEKIIFHLNMKKKQILKKPQAFKNCLEGCLFNICGVKFLRQNPIQRIIESLQQIEFENTSLLTSFDILMSSHLPELFLIDIFTIFMKILENLQKFGIKIQRNSKTLISIQAGNSIIHYILSIYFDEQKSEQFITNNQNFYIKWGMQMGQKDNIEIFQFFLTLVYELERISFKSQIGVFLSSILPPSTQKLHWNEIEQLLTVFLMSSNQNYRYYSLLSKYAQKPLPIHRLCLFAYRFDFLDLFNISSFVGKKYRKMYPGTEQNSHQKMLLKSMRIFTVDSVNVSWIRKIHEKMTKKCEIVNSGHTPNMDFIKYCIILTTIQQTQHLPLLGNHLNLIEQSYRKLCLKMGSEI